MKFCRDCKHFIALTDAQKRFVGYASAGECHHPSALRVNLVTGGERYMPAEKMRNRNDVDSHYTSDERGWVEPCGATAIHFSPKE